MAPVDFTAKHPLFFHPACPPKPGNPLFPMSDVTPESILRYSLPCQRCDPLSISSNTDPSTQVDSTVASSFETTLQICLVQSPSSDASAEPTEVVPSLNVSVYNLLNEMKLSIDQYREEWYHYKRYTNPFEFVNTNNPHESVCRMKPISRAYFKLFEVLQSEPWFQLPHDTAPTPMPPSPLRAFCLAEGPGGFIQALLQRRRAICAKTGTKFQDVYVGMTMEMPHDSTVPGWRKSRRFLEDHREWVTIERGSSGNGNMLLFENLKSILQKYSSSWSPPTPSSCPSTKNITTSTTTTTTTWGSQRNESGGVGSSGGASSPEVVGEDDGSSWTDVRRSGKLGSSGRHRRSKLFDLVTGDAGFDFSTDYSNQELNMSQLLLVQTLYAVLLLQPGGTFVLKIFDVFYEKTLHLLFMMSQWFAKVDVLKPWMSRSANSEKYVLCTGFHGLSPDRRARVLEFAQTVMSLSSDEFATRVLHYSLRVPLPFRNHVGVLNTVFAQSQIESINDTLKLITNPNRDRVIQLLTKTHLSLCVSWCTHFGFEINPKYSGSSPIASSSSLPLPLAALSHPDDDAPCTHDHDKHHETTTTAANMTDTNTPLTPDGWKTRRPVFLLQDSSLSSSASSSSPSPSGVTVTERLCLDFDGKDTVADSSTDQDESSRLPTPLCDPENKEFPVFCSSSRKEATTADADPSSSPTVSAIPSLSDPLYLPTTLPTMKFYPAHSGRFHRINPFSWLAHQPIKGQSVTEIAPSLPSRSSSAAYSFSARNLQLGLLPVTLTPPLPQPKYPDENSRQPSSSSWSSPPPPAITTSMPSFTSRPFFKKKRHVNFFQGPQTNMFLPTPSSASASQTTSALAAIHHVE